MILNCLVQLRLMLAIVQLQPCICIGESAIIAFGSSKYVDTSGG
jgi:hypothetical protein